MAWPMLLLQLLMGLSWDLRLGMISEMEMAWDRVVRVRAVKRDERCIFFGVCFA